MSTYYEPVLLNFLGYHGTLDDREGRAGQIGRILHCQVKSMSISRGKVLMLARGLDRTTYTIMRWREVGGPDRRNPIESYHHMFSTCRWKLGRWFDG